LALAGPGYIPWVTGVAQSTGLGSALQMMPQHAASAIKLLIDILKAKAVIWEKNCGKGVGQFQSMKGYTVTVMCVAIWKHWIFQGSIFALDVGPVAPCC